MGNEQMRDAWSRSADSWVRHEDVFDRAFAPVTDAIWAAAAPSPGERVLDVGCGSGTLLAAAVAAGAHATGVDISPGMVEAARRRVPSADVRLDDAQTADLTGLPGAPFDLVVSRFGVMFFADPTGAFANLRRAAPTGRLAFACWRGAEENPNFTLGSSVLAARLEPPAEPPRSGTPGPTAFADGTALAALLQRAGWRQVQVRPLDAVSEYGTSTSDGVEERLAVVLGTTTGAEARRVLPTRLGAAGWAALVEQARDAIRASMTGPTVQLPVACWLVTAD